jgi:SAM-dependent methyltransferase
MNQLEKFKNLITRQRIKPRIWDYSYILLKNNYCVFKKFRDIAIHENRTKILDVGCGFKPWLAMFDKNKVEYIGVDLDKEKSSADLIAPADKLPFPDNNFDALIYSEVLEHTENLNGVIKELHRVAKNGALVYISAPFVFPEHGIPYDFQRLSRYFYRNIFQNDEILLIQESNSTLSTAFVSLNLFIESTPFRILRGCSHLFYILNNTVGMSADWLIKYGLQILGNILNRSVFAKEQFYAMPLGYAVVVKIRK